MIEITLLEHFIAVANASSFTRAAVQLHISQPVLSRSIKRLEEKVGTALLERTSRKVALTAAGEAFLSEAYFIIERLKIAANDARRIGNGFTEKLRIRVCPSVNWHAQEISHAIRRFQGKWPDVQVEISPLMSVNQAAALLAADIDIGFINLEEVDCTDLEHKHITSVVPCVAVPSSWKLPKSGVTLFELRDRPWMIPDPKLAPSAYDKFSKVCRSTGFEPQIAVFAEDGATGAIQVACGLGAAFVEQPVNNPTVFEGMEFIPLKDLPDSLIVHYAIAWSATAPSSQIGNFLSVY
ncbi:LysR family transcriptional regulator [Zhongshania sp.]|uniref:LysR family transcriptional regulator n=1 Tax=Zhongshania sp. TaxID=1971902 RepID=UPI003568A048